MLKMIRNYYEYHKVRPDAASARKDSSETALSLHYRAQSEVLLNVQIRLFSFYVGEGERFNSMSNSIAEALMCLQLCFFCHLHSLYYQLRTCVGCVVSHNHLQCWRDRGKEDRREAMVMQQLPGKKASSAAEKKSQENSGKEKGMLTLAHLGLIPGRRIKKCGRKKIMVFLFRCLSSISAEQQLPKVLLDAQLLWSLQIAKQPQLLPLADLTSLKPEGKDRQNIAFFDRDGRIFFDSEKTLMQQLNQLPDMEAIQKSEQRPSTDWTSQTTTEWIAQFAVLNMPKIWGAVSGQCVRSTFTAHHGDRNEKLRCSCHLLVTFQESWALKKYSSEKVELKEQPSNSKQFCKTELFVKLNKQACSDIFPDIQHKNDKAGSASELFGGDAEADQYIGNEIQHKLNERTNLGLHLRQNPSSCKCSFPLLLSRGFYAFKREMLRRTYAHSIRWTLCRHRHSMLCRYRLWTEVPPLWSFKIVHNVLTTENFWLHRWTWAKMYRWSRSCLQAPLLQTAAEVTLQRWGHTHTHTEQHSQGATLVSQHSTAQHSLKTLLGAQHNTVQLCVCSCKLRCGSPAPLSKESGFPGRINRLTDLVMYLHSYLIHTRPNISVLLQCYFCMLLPKHSGKFCLFLSVLFPPFDSKKLLLKHLRIKMSVATRPEARKFILKQQLVGTFYSESTSGTQIIGSACPLLHSWILRIFTPAVAAVAWEYLTKSHQLKRLKRVKSSTNNSTADKGLYVSGASSWTKRECKYQAKLGGEEIKRLGREVTSKGTKKSMPTDGENVKSEGQLRDCMCLCVCVYMYGKKLGTTVIQPGRRACPRYWVVFAQERSAVCMFMCCCVQGNLYQQLEWDCGVWRIVCPDASNWVTWDSQIVTGWTACLSPATERTVVQ
ncbi:hypothetical protein EK904_006327, partial [Melospiza melodia maxima]